MTRAVFVMLLTAFTSSAFAQSPSATPNDCWFGVMAPSKAPHGQLVATGPVSQWRVGSPVVLYQTKETYEQITALAERGQTATFDTSRPITVIPTWIAGPEPGDKASGEDKSIEIMMRYRTDQGEIGDLSLTYWGPTSGETSLLPPDQRAAFAKLDQQTHDMNCRGIP